MVKLISVAAIILPTVISAVQGAFILSSGGFSGLHTVPNVNCASSVPYTKAKNTLKAGHVFCSYLPKVDMSLCQCHQADVTASNLDGFTADILHNIEVLGACSNKAGGINYTNQGTWINGFYEGNKFMSAAGFSNGKVSTNGCKPVGCSVASQGLSWRNFNSVSQSC
ncbi:hypothetical protein BGX24_006364 [Mortierella sp. AD032]|nr:hypothetical protein BGX24_006364 [Mortierella sp. AD032]